MESQFHADELHVGVDMAGGCQGLRGFRKCIAVQFKRPVKELKMIMMIDNDNWRWHLHLPIHLLYFLS